MSYSDLEIEPKDLIIKFVGSITETATSQFILKNVNLEQSIVFKVKTIDPKRYLVKPSKGILTPNQTQNITVVMNPIKVDKVGKFLNSKQKFAVQWLLIESGSNTESVVSIFSKAPRKALHLVKLKCEFNNPSTDTSNSEEISASSESLPRPSQIEGIHNSNYLSTTEVTPVENYKPTISMNDEQNQSCIQSNNVNMILFALVFIVAVIYAYVKF